MTPGDHDVSMQDSFHVKLDLCKRILRPAVERFRSVVCLS